MKLRREDWAKRRENRKADCPVGDTRLEAQMGAMSIEDGQGQRKVPRRDQGGS